MCSNKIVINHNQQYKKKCHDKGDLFQINKRIMPSELNVIHPVNRLKRKNIYVIM